MSLKLQVHRLRDPRVKNNMQVMLEERHHCVTAVEPGEQWKRMKTILQETTTEAADLSTRKLQDVDQCTVSAEQQSVQKY